MIIIIIASILQKIKARNSDDFCVKDLFLGLQTPKTKKKIQKMGR